MAEQYGYMGRYPGPVVDVNLYPNAVSAGISQGNAQDTTTSAIAKGVSSAINQGLDTYSKIQQIQAQGANNEVNTDQGVIDAKKAAIVAAGTADQIQADILKNNQTTIEETSALDLNRKLDASKIAAQDSTNITQLNDLSQAGNLEHAMAAYQDPTYAPTFARNPEFAVQYGQALKTQGGDPAILDPLQKQYEAIDYGNRVRGSSAHTQSLADKQAEKDSGLASKAQSYFDSNPEFSKFNPNSRQVANNFDPRLMSITPNKKSSAQGTPIGYDYSYGGQVIKENVFGKDERKQRDQELDAWKSSLINKIGTVPNSINKPTPPSSTQQNGVGLQQHSGITERDITKESQPKTILDTNPILRGAVTIGGFAPDIVKQTAPTWNKLGSTIQTISAATDPRSLSNSDALKNSVYDTAKDVSYSMFIRDPGLKASITQATIEEYNKKIAPSLFGGQVSALDLATQKPFLDSLLAKTPQDYYFKTQGGGIVTQVNDYAQKVLKANIQARQLQASKVQSNTTQANILKSIAGG